MMGLFKIHTRPLCCHQLPANNHNAVRHFWAPSNVIVVAAALRPSCSRESTTTLSVVWRLVDPVKSPVQEKEIGRWDLPHADSDRLSLESAAKHEVGRIDPVVRERRSDLSRIRPDRNNVALR